MVKRFRRNKYKGSKGTAEVKSASRLDMLHGPLAIKIVLMAIPILLSAVLQQLFNSADMVVIGRFAGENSLAAVGANTFVINLMVNLFVGLSIGSNVVIARLIGEGRKDDIQKAVSTSIAISLLSGVFLSVVGWMIAETVLGWMGTPEVIMHEAVTYFRIYFLGMPFYMLFNFGAAILRSHGDTRRPLYILAVCGVVNLLLNLFFVVNCKMSVAGVALATLLSSALSSMILLQMLRHEKNELKVHVHLLRIDMASLKAIAAVGIPAGIQGAIFNISNVMIQGGINSLGASAVAACTAALNFEFFSYFAVSAFSQSGMSFISQNYGAGQIARCRRIILVSLLLGVGCTALVSWTFIILRYGLASFFFTENVVIEMTAARMLVVLSFYFVNGLNDLLSSLMRGVGYSLTPALICIIGICGTRLIWMCYVFPANPTYDTLNYCYPVSWMICMCVMIPAAWYVLRKTVRR